MSTDSPSAATRREHWAWYLYDFGNSAYAAVVLLAVYSAYFQGSVVGGAEGSRLWGIAVGIAMLTVAIVAPILGTIADLSGAKKRFLLLFTLLAVVFCALLFFVQEGDWFIGMLFFGLTANEKTTSSQIINSMFQSVTARTAGFNTVEIGALPYASLFIMILLMFIGLRLLNLVIFPPC